MLNERMSFSKDDYSEEALDARRGLIAGLKDQRDQADLAQEEIIMSQRMAIRNEDQEGFDNAQKRSNILRGRQDQIKGMLAKERGDLRDALIKRRESVGVDPSSFPEYDISDGEEEQFKREVVDFDASIKYEPVDENDNGAKPCNTDATPCEAESGKGSADPTSDSSAASLGVAMAMAKHFSPAIGVTKIGAEGNQEFIVKHVTGEKKERPYEQGSPKIKIWASGNNDQGLEPGEILVEETLSQPNPNSSVESGENLVIDTSNDVSDVDGGAPNEEEDEGEDQHKE